MSALPSKFDWSDDCKGGLLPIRDQGKCGSWWVFARMGPIERNIKIRDGYPADLSEQGLVSCNQETIPRPSGCTGGFWAHDYFLENGKTDPCGDLGTVSETNYPYISGTTGETGSCECPKTHNYFIEDWAFIGSGPPNYAEPIVDQIKQAIFDFGPVTVAVCAGGYFKIYTGGVYDIETICLPKKVNHGVVLVGWDDSQCKEGVWI